MTIKNYAGTHVILDLFDATNLSDINFIKETLINCCQTIGATILDVQTHYFEPQGGVSGVVLLAESHMSIHTWPEHSYAAIDIFVCSSIDISLAIPILKTAFTPSNIQCCEIKRGMRV